MTVQRKHLIRVSIYGALGVILFVFFAHPCTRQMVFGPRINGQPFWYWQERYREAAAPADPNRSLTIRGLALIGIKVRHIPPTLSRSPDMLPVVLSLVDDPSPAVRRLIAELLSDYAEFPEACEALMELLHDSEPNVREQAIDSFGRLKPAYPAALPRLRKQLDDEHALCRVRAALALYRLQKGPDQHAGAVLRSAINAVPLPTRVNTIRDVCMLARENPECLDVVGHQIAIEPQMAPVYVPELGAAGSKAIGLLVELLQNENREVRQHAARTLGFVVPAAHEAVPALARAVADQDENVRFAAASALWQIDPERFEKPTPPPKKQSK
jgi:hypothetical protein